MEFDNSTNSSDIINGTVFTTVVDSSQSDYVNWSTVAAGLLHSTMSSTPTLTCSSGRTACNSSWCFDRGLCCVDQDLGVKHCVCHSGYTGTRCEQNEEDEDMSQFYEAVKNGYDHIFQAGVSSVISMIIGLLALAACIILVVVLVRRKLLLKKRSEDYLEQHLSDIQQELNSMPTVSKLVQLTRLSKMFQQSARVAIETTVLSADVRRIVVNPSPHVACLPRWSSSPASLSAGAPVDRATAADDVDAAVSPTLEPSVKHELQKVFSLDVGALQRSNEHQQQQQQQQYGSGIDRGAATTRL